MSLDDPVDPEIVNYTCMPPGIILSRPIKKRVSTGVATAQPRFLQVPKLCTDLDVALLNVVILYGKFALENKMRALSVCFPQPCSSTGRMINNLPVN